jgi:hypothetical protein
VQTPNVVWRKFFPFAYQTSDFRICQEYRHCALTLFTRHMPLSKTPPPHYGVFAVPVKGFHLSEWR